MTENHFNHWTLTDRAKLIKLSIEGKTNQELANILKRTYHAIGAYRRELVRKGLLIKTGDGSGTKYKGVAPSEFGKTITNVSAKPIVKRGPYKTKKLNNVKEEMSFAVKESNHTVSNSITYYQGGLITVNNKLYKEVESL